MSAEPEPIGDVLSRILHVTERACFGCGALVPHMIGLSSCPDCIAAWERTWRREEHKAKLSDLVDRRYIRKATLACTFSASELAKEDAEAYRQARTWAPSDHGSAAESIYLQGDIGCGKTYLARCLLNECLKYRKVRGAEISALEFTEIARQFDTKRFGESSAKRPSSPTEWLETLKCLIIDDLDKAPWNDRAISFLWQLLNRRRENKCVTIYTSNFPPRVVEGSDAHSLEKVLANHTKNHSMVAAIMDRMLPLRVIQMRGTSLRYREKPVALRVVAPERLEDVIDDGEPF